MSSLQLSLLGPFALTEDGQPIELNIAKLQALLGYLALTGRPQPRGEILALLWAESHADAARKNLRNRLWQLRQLTERDLIITEGDTLALAPNVQSDVVTFIDTIEHDGTTDLSQLHMIVDLWQGPLLDGLQLHEAPDFEIWLSQQREQLGQLYLQALSQIIEQEQTGQRWQQVIAAARQGLAFDPLHESLYCWLMLGYANLGQRSEALRQYTQLEQQLAVELDVAPLPETTALRDRIAANHLDFKTTQRQGNTETFPISPLVTAQTDDLSMATEKDGITPHRQIFIGRQAQLNQLTEIYQNSRQGAQVVLLSGELGIGKTTFWQEWTNRLPATAIVLATRCLNTTQALPLEPVRRLLGTAPCRTQWQQIAGQLLPIWREELLQLAPTLQTQSSAVQGATTVMIAGMTSQQEQQQSYKPISGQVRRAASEEQGLIAEAITQFLHTFRGKPLVLFIDDLHWTDGATLDWLLYLTDRMKNEPLLLVGACRPEDLTPPVNRVLAQWQRDGLLHRIALPHFTPSETAELLTTLGGDESVATYIHEQTSGNPYYLTQLSDVAVDGIPASLADLVQARLSYLNENWQPVLQAAAILEPAIDLPLLCLTGGQSEDETVDALDGLLIASILVEQGEEYEFTHPLVATVVREGLSSGRRKLLHRRAAEGLLAQSPRQEHEIAGQVAHHYAAAGRQEEAAHYAAMAGAEALRIGAANEAVAFYQRAQELVPTPERQLGLGEAMLLQPGQLTEGRYQMERALIAYETAGDHHGVIKVGLRLAASYLGTQEGTQVLHWAQRVLPDLETVADPILHASAQYLMGTAKFRTGHAMAEADIHYRIAMQLVEQEKLGAELAVRIYFEWGNLALEEGAFAAAVHRFQAAHRLAQECQSIFFTVLALNNLSYAQLCNGQIEEAQQTIEQALALADTHAMLSARYYLLSTQGEIALATEALTEAESVFRAAMLLAEKYNNLTFVANLWAHLGRVSHAKGDLSTANEYLNQAQHLLAEEQIPHLQTQIDLWHAAIALAQKDVAAVNSYLDRAANRLKSAHYPHLHEKESALRQAALELGSRN